MGFLMAALMVSAIMAACGKTLTEISVTTQPTKVAYTEGEVFNPAGMVVTATYSDESNKAVTGFDYSPKAALGLSDTVIKITYTEGDVVKEAQVAITVAVSIVGKWTPESLDVTMGSAKVSLVVAQMTAAERVQYSDFVNMTMDFKADGTLIMDSPGETETGKYRMEGDKVIPLDADGKVTPATPGVTETYELKDGKFVMNVSITESGLTFTVKVIFKKG